MKKGVLLCLTLLIFSAMFSGLTVWSAGAVQTDDILFRADFDLDVTPERIELQPGDNPDYGLYYKRSSQTGSYSSSACIEDGRLYLSATQGSGNVDSVWFNDVVASPDGDYTIEADFCYTTNPGSRYLGLMYRVKDERNFQKAYVTPTKVSANGQVNGSWYNDVPGYNKFDYSSGVTTGTPFKMKVELNGSNATLYYAIYTDYESKTAGEYIEVMTIDNIPSSQLTGVYGFLISGCTAWIDNIAVTLNSNGQEIFQEDFDSLGQSQTEVNLTPGDNSTHALFYRQANQTGSYTSSATLRNGRLYLSATQGSSNLELVYFTNPFEEGDYIVEADLCYETNPGSRYLGLMYRVQDGANFQKSYVTPTKVSANGQVNGNWYNDVAGVNKFDYASGVTTGTPFRIKMVVKGNTAALYYAIYQDYGNNILPEYTYVTTVSNIPESQKSGSFGFLVSGCTAWIDNLEVRSYTNIEEDFSTAAMATDLPEGWSGITGSTGHQVQNGSLYLNATAGLRAVQADLPTVRNYQVEVDATILSGSSSGWASITFRNRTLAGWNNAKIGLDGVAAINTYRNNVPFSVTAPVPISTTNGSIIAGSSAGKTVQPGQTYRLKLVVERSRARMYVDGQLMTTLSLTSDWDVGGVGLAAGGAEVAFDNFVFRRIEVEEIPPAQVAEVYIPGTGIVNPPAVIANIDSTAAYQALTGAQTPTTALFHVNENLDIVSGSAVIDTLDNAVATLNNSIPAFFIDSQQTAAAIAGFINERQMSDAFIVASRQNASLVKAVRQQCPSIRGAIWMDSNPTTLAEKVAAQNIVNNNLANLLILPETIDVEDMDYYNRRSISVWGQVQSTAAVYAAIANGYNGVVIEDYSTAYQVYESITATTVSGKPAVAAHRGHTSYPENTLLAFEKAMEQGVKLIETDLRLSADGEIVLMHDATVDRTTNGTGNVASLTLTQIKNLVVDNVNGYAEPVPTLAEMFERFKGEDMVMLCHINVTNATLRNRLAELLDEYGIGSQVIVFARSAQSSFSNTYLQNVSFIGGVSYPFSQAMGHTDAIKQLIEANSPYNYMPIPFSAGVYTDYLGTGWDFCYALNARGMLPWVSTTNNRNTLNATLMTRDGFFAALTDYIGYASDYAYSISAENQTVTVGSSINLGHTLKSLDSSFDQTVQCRFLQLDGVDIEANGTASQSGTATIVYYYDVVDRHASPYRVYASPVIITVE